MGHSMLVLGALLGCLAWAAGASVNSPATLTIAPGQISVFGIVLSLMVTLELIYLAAACWVVEDVRMKVKRKR